MSQHNNVIQWRIQFCHITCVIFDGVFTRILTPDESIQKERNVTCVLLRD